MTNQPKYPRAGAVAATSEADELLLQDPDGTTATPAASQAQGKEKAKKPLPEIPISERAEINCQADLDRVLKAHRSWVEAVLNPSVDVAAGRANLAGADLRGYDLVGVNLSGANLQDALLTGCKLSGANLMAANLKGAQLQDCDLRHAKLSRAKIDGADLRGANLSDAIMSGVDLTKAITRSPDAEKPTANVAEEVEVAVQSENEAKSTARTSAAPTIDARPGEAAHAVL